MRGMGMGLHGEQQPMATLEAPTAFAEGTLTGLAPVRLPSRRVITSIADDGLCGRLGIDLAWMDCDVFDANDGLQMVHYISEAILDEPDNRRPDLIVADAVSPGCNGLSVLAGIRDLGWNTPVVLLLRRDQMHLYRMGLQLGASSLSVAPHSAEDIAMVCRQLLNPTQSVHHGCAGPGRGSVDVASAVPVPVEEDGPLFE